MAAPDAPAAGPPLRPVDVRPPGPPINDLGPARVEPAGVQPGPKVQTIPWWQSSFDHGGQTYRYAMVGTNPADGAVTTTVKAKIVPLRLVFESDGQVLYDPGMVADVLASPVFTPVDVGLGPTQWHDLYQRVSLATPPGWQVNLQPEVLPTQTLTVPSDQGFTRFDDATQRRVGVTNLEWVRRKNRQLIEALHISPRELPVFLADNTIASLTSAADCLTPEGCHAFAGLHDIMVSGGRGQQPPPQVHTLVWATWRDFGVALPPWLDIRSEPLSHEVVEWAADPFLSNVVPQWEGVFIGPSHPCQDVMEVADPVEGLPIGVNLPGGRVTAVTNATTLSWFARESPSHALAGLYDLTGLVTQPSQPCS